MAPVGLNLCNSYHLRGYVYKTIEVVPDIIKLIEKEKRESDFFNMPMNVYCAFCVYLGYASGWAGNFRHGEAFCEKGLYYAQQLGDSRSIAYVELYYGFFYMLRGSVKSP